jgi:ADP-heptose:LPS heptosyltransferase
VEPDSAPSAILIVQPSRLGDVLLTSTLLDDLRRAFPSARLDFLTRENAAPLLTGHPLIARVLGYT